jgi:putative heme-binding domain-containing protein
MHAKLWQAMERPGKLTLRTQLDLANMLQPVTQPGSQLGYVPEPEVITLHFKADAALEVSAPGAKVTQVSETESTLTVTHPKTAQWQAMTLTLSTPATRLDVAYTNGRDAHRRAPGVRRFLLPFAKPAAPDVYDGKIPELAGGDWNKGHALFNGKAACFTCHSLRGEGVNVGPDLNNLIHRDYAGVLRDIVDPSAVINPDAIGYTVTQTNGQVVVGTRVGETEEELHLAQPTGPVAKLKKSTITKTEALPASLMPAGLDKILSPAELRDLMTYLLRPKAE